MPLKILFLTNRFPYPPYRGDKLKIYNITRRLKQSHELYLVSFYEDAAELDYIPEINKIFKEHRLVYFPKYRSYLTTLLSIFSSRPLQVSYFRNGKMRAVLKDFVKTHQIDIIHTQHLRMAQYTKDIKGVKTILDLPDAYSLYWERRYRQQKNPLRKIFEFIEYKRVLKYENVLKEFDNVLVCSPEDKNHLLKYNVINNIRILPNGVDTDTFYSDGENAVPENRIIFTGNMSYAPNVDAVTLFAERILPELKKKVKNVKFCIAGQNPTEEVKKLSSDEIEVTGFVKDLKKEYMKSKVAVSSVRFGAGTLNKVLEPMALGIPVVTSPIGFKGLGIKSGEGAILAKDDSQFISELYKLLTSEDYRKKVGGKGREVINQRFSWDIIVKNFEECMYELKEQGNKK